MKRKLLAGLLLTTWASLAGGLSIDSTISNGAVFQRDRKIRVCGCGSPGAVIKVRFAEQAVESTVDPSGTWCATLKPMPASIEGRELEACCGNERCLVKDVLVGEVFLCSGQSNMQQPLFDGGWGGGFSDRAGILESKLANWPLFRYASVSRIRAAKPQKCVMLSWTPVDNPTVAAKVSAICYYFASTLMRAEPRVPVGIVNSSWGGTRIEPWVPGVGGEIYNAMVYPLRNLAFRAVLWYQGESNLGDGRGYTEKLRSLIRGWRTVFGDAEMPFIVSEIAPYSYWGDSLAKFWDAQQSVAREEKDVWCVPINDCGDRMTIHPDRKLLPALRYASIALNRFYGRKEFPCEIPTAKKATAEAGGVWIDFDGTSQLGVSSFPQYAEHRISGFELCGTDGKWHPAKAEICRNRVRAYAATVPSPRRVRYLGWGSENGALYAADTDFVPSAFELEVGEESIDAVLQKKCQAVCDWAVHEGLQGAVQFCAYRDGKCIVDVWAGNMTTNACAPKISGSTLFPVFSTEKPLLATAAHRAVEKRRMSYSRPLSTWWPEFTGEGKENVTLGLALAYRTGMEPGFPKGIQGVDERCDWEKICSLAAAIRPVVTPGTVQRYHSISYAWLIGRPLEKAMGRPLNKVLTDEVLLPCSIEEDFYFAADDKSLSRIVTVYKDPSFEEMNDVRCQKMCLPSAYAVADARAIARFYNRLCGFDGMPPLVSPKTLEVALRPSRHESDPLPDAKSLDSEWHMIFGMGYGLWGPADRLSRIFGHGGIGGSEGLCDLDRRLTVGFTCNFGEHVREVRSKLYGLVGMKWRYWSDADADIQEMQMSTLGRMGNERDSKGRGDR